MLRKKWLSTTILSFAVIGSACTGDFAGTGEELYHENGNTINVSDRNELYNKNLETDVQNRGQEFGYVRHQKSPIEGRTMSNEDLYSINREQVADSISKMSVDLPDVSDVATLVTDEEVLVSYVTDETDEDGRFEVADQVKKTALSVVPRWYHVYVTDDPQLMKDVENLASMDTNMANVNRAIDDTVKLMLQDSPQGRKVDAGENANGEMIDEKYNMDDDDVHQSGQARQKRIDNTNHGKEMDYNLNMNGNEGLND